MCPSIFCLKIAYNNEEGNLWVYRYVPVKWKLARDLDMLSSDPLISFLLSKSDRDLVMMSVDLGLYWGMAEWGKMLERMGVTIMCSVQEVSNTGFWILSTSTLRLRCSNGQENVSDERDWSQERSEISLSLNSLSLKMLVNSIELELLEAVAFCWQ